MAIPSGKFYQYGAFPGIKDYSNEPAKWDLADLCESDSSWREGKREFKNIKVNGRPISVPFVPAATYDVVKTITTDYKQGDNVIVKFPQIGTFPTALYPNKSILDNSNIVYGWFEGNDSASKTLRITRNLDGWYVDHVNQFPKSVFYRGIVPQRIAIFLQGAGAGGGSQAGSLGGGGGSGACALFISPVSDFELILGQSGATNRRGGGAAIQAPQGISLSNITCGGGEVGRTIGSGGEGGKFSIYQWGLSGGLYANGVSGAGMNFAGKDFEENPMPLYDDIRCGFTIAKKTGGSSGSGIGGGGGASALSNGGDGGTRGAALTQPGYGAGGGGTHNTNSTLIESRGGKSLAVIYFGYSA